MNTNETEVIENAEAEVTETAEVAVENKETKSLLSAELKAAITTETVTEYTGKTREEIKAAIAANSAKAQENEDLNNKSIELYRSRANESRVLRTKNKALRTLLSAEKKAVSGKEVLEAMSIEDIKALLASREAK